MKSAKGLPPMPEGAATLDMRESPFFGYNVYPSTLPC